MLTINERLQIPLREFEFDFVRSGGPGGQNVNKVATKAVMKWDITNTQSLPDSVKKRFCSTFARRIGQDGMFTITSQRFRDRGRNVADCLSKLRALVLEVAVPPKPRRKTKPTKASKIRRMKGKKQQSEKKQRRRPPGVE
ncbi:MAG: aminoacyl-tRNA hydrolase [Planctomycetales bacterium]|nr:aminoacyl-tRNA hydrolase [Planctomycetales bacterium]